MRKMQRNRGLWAVSATVLGMCVTASVASAAPSDVTTEQAGAVVVYPKVIWDGNRDTVIQIANTSNMPVTAHCYYVDAGTPGLWVETDFYLYLTKQQPTHWVASTGRRVAWDEFGSDGSGFDPGLVPPVRLGFAGELKCVQEDGGDPSAPLLSANQLKGEAVLRNANGDVSKYNAIAFRGNGAAAQNANPYELDLNWTATNGTGQLSACPNSLELAHAAEGAPEISGTTTHTELTLVPCFEDFENQNGGQTTVGLLVWNEFEERYSTSFPVDCWFNMPLAEVPGGSVLTYSNLGTMGAHTQLMAVPAQGGQPQQVGVIGVAEQYFLAAQALTTGPSTVGIKTGYAAANIPGVGTRPVTNPSVDQFVLSQP